MVVKKEVNQQVFVRTSSNITLVYTGINLQKKLLLKTPPHLKCIASLPCEIIIASFQILIFTW